MNKPDHERVLHVLNDYPNMMRKISILRFELEHPTTVAPEDMLEAMNYAHGDGGGVPNGTVSNKTLYIAMNYQYAAERANSEIRDQILARLLPLEQKIKRVDYYLGLLTTNEEMVLRRMYIEKQRLSETAATMNISVWTARRLRDKAVEKLAEMVSFAEGGGWE